MLLKALRDYELAQSGRLPAYYAEIPVRWKYHLDTKTWEKTEDENGDPVPVVLPAASRTNAGTPFLISDTATYVFGLADADKAEKGAKYVGKYRDLLKAADEAGVDAAARVLKALDAGLKPPAGMTPNDHVAFCEGGKPVTDDKEVQAFWADYQDADKVTGREVACAVCGEVRRTVRLTAEVVGVPDSRQGKCKLVSANAKSTEKYGRTQAHGAALCGGCARDVVRGLNKLVAQKFLIVATQVCVWADGGDADVPVREALTAPTGETARKLRAGEWLGRVHVLVLTARDARAVVRLFETVPAAELAARLAEWLEIQGDAPHGLVDATYQDPVDPKKKTRRAGLLGLMHPKREVAKVHQGVVADVLAAVLTGAPLPAEFSAAADFVLLLGEDAASDKKKPDPLPAAAAAELLARRYLTEGALMSTVRVADTVPYRCGVLLAYLEKLQRSAVPRINRTVADACLKTVGVNPRAVLGEAMADARVHLSKLARLNRERPYMDAINSCVEGLEVPEQFSAEDQAAFCLGYYSIASARTGKEEAPEPAGV